MISVGNILTFLLICTVLKICVSLIKFCYWNRKIPQVILRSKFRFFNLLRNISDLSFSERSRNGYSILVCAQQVLAGYSKLFVNAKLYCLWLFFFPIIVLAKAEAVEAIFGGVKTTDKPFFYNTLLAIFGTGLLTSNGTKWKSRRKTTNPCFRYDILKEYVPTLNEHAQILKDRLKAETNKDFTRILKLLSHCSFDVICEFVMGVHMRAQESSTEPEFLYSTKRSFILMSRRMLNIFLWPDFIFYRTRIGKEAKRHIETVKAYARSLVQEEKRKFLEGELKFTEGKKRSLMNMLLEHHLQMKDFSEEDVIEELITFIISGHDTTSAAITWTLYMLGLYPDIQRKVHEELDWIFGEDVKRPATEDDLKDMKYLECVIKETLRLYPPVPLFGRQMIEDTNICDTKIPKGTTCMVFTHVLHRDEEVFPNPEKFDPDRFLPENSLNRNPYAYIPFSAGPRNCIGQKLSMMEQMIITSTILRNYTIESLDQRDQLLPELTFVISSSKPIRIRIRPRILKIT
ncbi:cytochrome P450 4V2 [Nephila pilipes]|uniref:Cytochrome P450 4V2 n=1 Tax=Nephila pilipes TaxID=299642 RepID=A0A8X6PSE6_NEPPI|nr:cytochrome P450 4V2 [Nephila pilipes]